ncbi:unnamed protein product [Ilex paraguariensis]|uniref:Chlororespiratory reduction 4 n=1 Tax=Ilex paraguariensis TaxID=185542 RepID=A0ABC8RZ42_9AQUA
MVTSFVNIGKFDKAEELYAETPMNWCDPVCSNALLNGYLKMGRLDQAIRVFEGMVEKDVVSWSSMVDGYCRNGRLGEARVLFDRMEEKNVVTWTAMINGYVKMGCFKDGFGLFVQMRRKDVVKVVSNTLTVIFEACGRLGRYEEGCQVHGLVLRMGFEFDFFLGNYVLSMYCRFGCIDAAINVFCTMKERDVVSWNSLIAGYVQVAICWFIDMLQQAVRPNPLTLSCVLSASAGLATLNQGLQVHVHVVKMDMELDLSILNSLILMYSKCVPNEITFLGVLSACTHMGMVEEGWRYFKSMRYSYKIEPGPDHYACMVDLLGRAGLLDQAINFITSMPLEPHFGVWGALLGASRNHVQLDLAKLAAQHLSELEPHNAAPYVVLSNLYSVLGNMKDEEQVRIAKKLKGIKKSPGCSWIMVQDKVNLFHFGDRSHVKFEEIKSIVWTILDEMRW